jgi:cold shock CspA family protein
MSVTDDAITTATATATATATKVSGRVKWFNNKTGFGFITALTDCEGVKEGTDVFAHHTAIKVSQEQYRYLVQGEYVEFVLSKIAATDAAASKHEFQAVDVSGVKGGKLICETRWENRSIGSGSTGSGSGPESGSSRFKRDESQDGWNYVGAASNRSFVPRQGSTEWRSSSGRGRGYGRGGASTGPASSSE